MNTNEIRERILEECRQNGITLTEDELNAKVLEAGRMDPEKLERLSGGGHLVDCDKANLCWSEFKCFLLRQYD